MAPSATRHRGSSRILLRPNPEPSHLIGPKSSPPSSSQSSSKNWQRLHRNTPSYLTFLWKSKKKIPEGISDESDWTLKVWTDTLMVVFYFSSSTTWWRNLVDSLNYATSLTNIYFSAAAIITLMCFLLSGVFFTRVLFSVSDENCQEGFSHLFTWMSIISSSRWTAWSECCFLSVAGFDTFYIKQQESLFFLTRERNYLFFKIRQFCPNTNVFWGHFGPLPGNLPNVLSNQSIFWPWIVMWLRFKPPWGGAGRRVGHRCLSSRFLSLGVQNTFTGSLKPPRAGLRGRWQG